MADLQIPPIRTPLTNGTDAPAPGSDVRTAKEWYYYWRQLGGAIRAVSRGLQYGTHTDRLDTTDAPNGALWVETDRGNTIYESQDDGAGGQRWVYVTGTMYGTLSPDQRPTDLRSFDAGFVYRTTDTNTDYAPREFIWSGAEWIETTRVLYGTHAARPAADEKTPARTLYVETDRGNTIYQQQANAWVYAAGTMYGTISPDERPAGLGANDAGFKFGATDTKRAYRWTGSAWAETTPQTPWTSDIDAAGFTLKNAGRIGVATPTPSAAVDVNGTIRATGGLDPTSGVGVELAYVGGMGYISSYDRSAGAYTSLTIGGDVVDIFTKSFFQVLVNGIERMRVTAAGNLGINKTNPGSKLSVVGLPTSASGLTSGDVWVDIAAGNVLKIVP